MTLSYSVIEHFDDNVETSQATSESTTESLNNTNTESSVSEQEQCLLQCQEKCNSAPSGNELEDSNDEPTTSSSDEPTTSSSDEPTTTSLNEGGDDLVIEDGSVEPTTTTERFSNMNNLNLNSGRSLWSLDLFLKAILFACLFYVLAHNKTRSAVTKYIVRGKENGSYVLMLVFAVVYYLLHLVV